MRENFKLFVSDKFIRASLAASLLFFLLVVGVIFVSFPHFPPYIPFFNSLPWGEERLFSSKIIYAVPLILFMVFIINSMIGVSLYVRFTLIARIMSFNTFLVFVLAFLAYLQIILLVF